MKKLFLALIMSVADAGASFAGSYKLNDQAVDAAFAASQDISTSLSTDLNFAATPDAEITKGGYLLRAFFCGSFALHRKYMGNGGKTLWYMYLCIPVAGGVVGCVDFWGVVFKGDEFMAKFKDNPKWIVWN